MGKLGAPTDGTGCFQISGGKPAPALCWRRSPACHRKKKLSYVEAREFASIEDRIHEAEQNLQARRAALEDPAITSDRVSLQNACTQLDEAQKFVDTLYARSAELEQKQASPFSTRTKSQRRPH